VGTTVEPVKDRWGLREFLLFPWKVYQGDPYWVPPLLLDLRQRLSPKNPFFERAKIELFVARRNGEVVGRIAAIRNDVHVEVQNERAGFFGLFESIDDPEVGSSLIGAASSWLKSQGMVLIRGPMNFSTNDEIGLLIEDFHERPRLMMPYNPPYYGKLLERCGMRKAKDLFAYDIEVPEGDLPERVLKGAEAARRAGITVRPVNLKRFTEEVFIIREIYNIAWRHNWGFIPFSENEILFMAKSLKPLVVPELALIAEDRGKPVGFILFLPDYNYVLAHLNGRLFPLGLLKFFYYKRKIEELRLIAFGILPGYRRKGIDALFYVESFKYARGRYKKVEGSWILEDNLPSRRAAERWGARPTKRYRIYEKDL